MLAEQIARRRWWIVGGCIVAEWVWVTTLALTSIEHNGWIYQHGDDGPWYWTTAWALSTFHVPIAGVGLGWPYLLTPFAAVVGPDMANGLPAVVALNVIVVLPACIVLVYLVAERLAGAAFAAWAAVVWTAAPLAAVALYRDTSRHVLLDSFFPTGLGLNALSDFPSMALALAAVYLVLRLLDTNDDRDAVLCGVTFGFLLLTKPANAPLLAVAGASLLVARRFRPLAVAALSAAPGLIALVVWKKRGAGVTIEPPPGSGGGGGATGAPSAAAPPHGLIARAIDLGDNLVHLPGRYVVFDSGHASANLHALREVFWSLRLLEFVLLVGAFALVARLRWRGLLVVAWFAAYFAAKGLSVRAGVYDTSAYRFLLPAWPAFVLMLAALVLLWPRGARPSLRLSRFTGATSRVPCWGVAGAVVVFGVFPAALATAAPLTARGTIAQIEYAGAPIAIRDFGLSARRTPAGVRLTWRAMDVSTANAFFRIYRADDPGCVWFSGGAPSCGFVMTQLGYAMTTTFVDRHAQRASYYRVALAAGAHFDDDSGSDLLLLSKPVFSAR